MMIRSFVAAALAVGLSLAAVSAEARLPDPESAFGQALGRVVTPAPPPPFPVMNATGAQSDLSSFKGRVTLVVWWATWCPYCAAEMPQLAALQARLGGGLAIAPLSLDDADPFGRPVEDPVGKVRRFYDRLGLSNFPLLLDAGGQNADFAGVRVTPTTFVVNKAGLVVGVLQGPAPWESAEAEAYLRGLMAE